MRDSVGQGKAYEKVIDYIQGEILKGDLKRGEKLPPERELAELLGVGRNSVREAMRTLSLMGFISSTQGAGNFVSCNLEKNLAESTRMMMMLNETDYRQISELRQGLESQAILLAAERIAQAQLSRLGRLPGRCGGPEWSRAWRWTRNSTASSERHRATGSSW